ncbi:MAG: MFS transporter [Microthrixaceae bacterium]
MPSPATASPRPLGGRLVPLIPAIVASILPVFLVGALAGPMGDDLGYGEATTGLLMAAFFAMSALVAQRAGTVADAVGPVTSLQIGLAGSGLAAGMVATLGRSVPLLAVAMMLGGASNALTQVAANVYVARHLPIERHGVAFAVKQSANPGGALVAGLVLPVLVVHVGWRSAFVLAATGAAVSAVALVPARSWEPLAPPRRGHRPQGAGPARHAPRLADPALWLLAAAAACGSASAVALGGFFVESARDAGMSLATAGLAASLGSGLAIAGRVVVGTMADRRASSPEAVLRWVAAMLAVGALALLSFGLRVPTAHWIALAPAFGAGWAWPGAFNLAVVRARPGSPGRATGVSQTGIYVGTTAGPLILGPLSEHAGYGLTWAAAAVMALLGAAGIAMVRLGGEPGAMAPGHGDLAAAGPSAPASTDRPLAPGAVPASQPGSMLRRLMG